MRASHCCFKHPVETHPAGNLSELKGRFLLDLSPTRKVLARRRWNRSDRLVHRLAYNGDVVAFKMGCRLPILNAATLRAAGGWLFFRVARSVFEEGGARNRAYLAGPIATMEIKGLATLRLKPL